MAHIKKFSKAKIQNLNIYSEWLRTAKEYKNEKIDVTKSHLNVYSKFAEPPFTKIKNLWDKNEKVDRSNSIKLAGIVVTLPRQLESLPYEKQLEILEECNTCYAEIVRKKQVDKNFDLNVGWQIHADESRLHIHCQFVPLDYKTLYVAEKDEEGNKIPVENRVIKDQYYGFAFQEIFDREFYRTHHNVLEQHIKNKFPELQIYDELFVESEIAEDKYLDENGFNIGNESHWQLKKRKNKLVSEISDLESTAGKKQLELDEIDEKLKTVEEESNKRTDEYKANIQAELDEFIKEAEAEANEFSISANETLQQNAKKINDALDVKRENMKPELERLKQLEEKVAKDADEGFSEVMRKYFWEERDVLLKNNEFWSASGLFEFLDNFEIDELVSFMKMKHAPELRKKTAEEYFEEQRTEAIRKEKAASHGGFGDY